ncbi:hypothetical protein GQ54DRAFT_210400 [Martensiomyces pterosporus]|nr:hypothetical protein GQ54DRAFT_210400 [Martensiomyces pterosporus]
MGTRRQAEGGVGEENRNCWSKPDAADARPFKYPWPSGGRRSGPLAPSHFHNESYPTFTAHSKGNPSSAPVHWLLSLAVVLAAGPCLILATPCCSKNGIFSPPLPRRKGCAMCSLSAWQAELAETRCTPPNGTVPRYRQRTSPAAVNCSQKVPPFPGAGAMLTNQHRIVARALTPAQLSATQGAVSAEPAHPTGEGPPSAAGQQNSSHHGGTRKAAAGAARSLRLQLGSCCLPRVLGEKVFQPIAGPPRQQVEIFDCWPLRKKNKPRRRFFAAGRRRAAHGRWAREGRVASLVSC